MEYLLHTNCLIYKGEDRQMCVLIFSLSYNRIPKKRHNRDIWTGMGKSRSIRRPWPSPREATVKITAVSMFSMGRSGRSTLLEEDRPLLMFHGFLENRKGLRLHVPH